MDELNELRRLAGIQQNSPGIKSPLGGSNISMTGTEKKKIEREKNIRPGTDEWFALWFDRPGLTGQMPTGFRGRKR
jgi:hypothetical protein